MKSADLFRYGVWAAVVAVGAGLAMIDRRVIGRRLFALLLLVGVAVGLATMSASPFSFGGGSWYMEGVIVTAGCAMALAGYVAAALWHAAFSAKRGA